MGESGYDLDAPVPRPPTWTWDRRAGLDETRRLLYILSERNHWTLDRPDNSELVGTLHNAIRHHHSDVPGLPEAWERQDLDAAIQAITDWINSKDG